MKRTASRQAAESRSAGRGVRRIQRRRRADRGFTLIEVLIYLAISGLVVGAVYQLTAAQQRDYLERRSRTELQARLRRAAAYLSAHARPAHGSDLHVLGPDRIGMRVYTATGVICRLLDEGEGYTIHWPNGDLTAAAGDSALLFSPAGPHAGDDRWSLARLQSVRARVENDERCVWDPTKRAGEYVVQVVGDTVGVRVGSILRAYVRREFGHFQAEGDWWLGWRPGSEEPWETLTGPLASPADSGVVFRYLDGSGQPTTDPALVDVVDVELRGCSGRPIRRADGSVEAVTESHAARIHLRG